jgi:hypothetical protein
MAKQTYALEIGGPRRLVMDWKYGYRNVVIYLDGALIGKVPGQKELQDGLEFALPDGSKLEVQLVRSFLSTDISLERNGKPLPGSATDPLSQVRLSYQLIFFLVIINLVLGGLTLFLQAKSLTDLGLGWYNIAFGLVFIGLGFWVRSLSLLALWVTVVLLALDAGVTVIGMSASGGETFYTGLLVRALILIYVWRGIGALKKLKQEEV